MSETWKKRFKKRFIEIIGVRGRVLVAKSPALCRWVWPDEYAEPRTSPDRRRIILDVALPRKDLKPVRSPAGV